MLPPPVKTQETQKLTSFGHYYKQKTIFWIHSLNDVCGLYYRLHTSFNE